MIYRLSFLAADKRGCRSAASGGGGKTKSMCVGEKVSRGLSGPKQRFALPLRAVPELAAPHTWPAAVLPVLLGTSLAYAAGAEMGPWIVFCVLAAAVLLQSAINTLNDFRDFVSGLDSRANCTDPHDAALIYAGASPGGALALGLLFLLGAAFFGAMLIWQCGAAMLWYGVLALAAIALYVIPGVSLADRPFGELLSGAAMGGVLTAAAYHASAGEFSWRLICLCLPAVITVGCIMLVNNTSDIEKDVSGGRRTLPVCLGRKRAELLLRCAVSAAAAGAVLFTGFFYPAGIVSLCVGAVGLLTNRGVRGLFSHSVTPARRKENMTAVLTAHKWIIGCYAAAVLLSAL